jgi:phage replication O-like protein O
MASPQLKNGYTRIANELLEAIIGAKLNGTQYAIVLAIIRATYGYHRKSKTLGIAFFKENIGRHRRQIAVELDSLIKRNVVKVVCEHTYGKSRELQLNKDYGSWQTKKEGMSENTHRGMSEITHLPMSEDTH